VPSSLVLASGFTTASILTLVVPVAIFLVVAVWYYVAWHESSAEHDQPPSV
jgi:hypothetical protein